jgi:hypothetical protein
MLLLALVGFRSHVEEASGGVSIRPSVPPPAERREALIRWRTIYRSELAPVHRTWSAIAKLIREGRVEDLPKVCSGLQQSLAKLDREQLLAAPDAALRTWIGQTLALLDSAAGHCRRGRVFSLDFRLHKARRLLLAIDRRLETY